MANVLLQPSFSSGELDPRSYGRVDIAKYQTGAKIVRNFITQVHGGITNRQGTDLVAEVKSSTVVGRLLPFEFSTTQSYVLAFGNSSMLVVKDGGLVLEANKVITGTTNASPVVVTSNAHGYSNGNRVFVSGTGLAYLDNKYWIVANVAANTFELSGSAAPGATSATGTVARVFDLAAPYTEAQLPGISYAQLNDVMTLAHSGVRPKNLSRTDHAAWTFADMPFEAGPFQNVNVTSTKGVVASATTGSVTIKSSHPIFSANNIGQLFYIEQKDYGKPWEVGKAVSDGDVRRSDGKYYEALGGGTTGTLRPSHFADVASDGTVEWLYLHNGWGVVLITAYTDAYTVTGTVQSLLPSVVVYTEKTITGAANNGSGLVQITSNAHGFSNDDYVMVYGVTGTTEANGLWRISGVTANTFDLEGSAFANAYVSGGKATKNGTYKWALGAWGGDQGWPSALTYFQQRKLLAATTAAPSTIWPSGTNAFQFFGKSAPIADDDSFNMVLASNQSNAIRHLASHGKLITFTAGSKWVIPDDDNNPTLTPSKRSARPQGSIGASTVRPIEIEDSVVYVADKGQAVYDISYQFATNSYAGNDLSVLSQHLLENHTIIAAAYQHVPDKIMWMVRDDGVLIGLTYLKEHQVWGWHRHDTGNGRGWFEDVCVISEGGEHRVYFLVRRRTKSGATKRYIERMASRLHTDVKDDHYVDCGLRYDGRNTSATTMTLSGGTTWSNTESLTLTASATHFKSTDVGSEIHFYEFTLDDNGDEVLIGRVLRLAITAYTSGTVVTVQANHTVPTNLRTVARTNWGHARKTFINADHLEGETISILADAHVHPQVVVASGSFTLQYAAVVVHAGLPIESDFQTLNLNLVAQGSQLDKQKLVFKVNLLVDSSRGIFAGPDADNLMEYGQRDNEGYDEPVTPLSGIAKILIPATWEPGGSVFVRQSDPVPLSILAIIPDFDIGGSK